jgi:hypothetical protein
MQNDYPDWVCAHRGICISHTAETYIGYRVLCKCTAPCTAEGLLQRSTLGLVSNSVLPSDLDMLVLLFTLGLALPIRAVLHRHSLHNRLRATIIVGDEILGAFADACLVVVV